VTQVLPSVPQILPASQHLVPDAQVCLRPASGRMVKRAETKFVPHGGDTLGRLPTAQNGDVLSPTKACEASQQRCHAVR